MDKDQLKRANELQELIEGNENYIKELKHAISDMQESLNEERYSNFYNSCVTIIFNGGNSRINMKTLPIQNALKEMLTDCENYVSELKKEFENL